MEENVAQIVIKSGHIKPLIYGHPWVFAEAVQNVSGEVRAGDQVRILGPAREFFGRGFINPNCAIRVRIASTLDQPLDRDWFSARIDEAVRLRKALLRTGRIGAGAHRLISSEGDFLPGLIVDRFGQYLTVQFHTAAVDRMRDLVVEKLSALENVAAIVDRSDPDYRVAEGLAPSKGVLWGKGPLGPVSFELDGLILCADVEEGQKTGFYLDQDDNRRFVASFAAGRRVLDLFAHSAAFALYALKAGAASAVAVDSSNAACNLAQRQAEANALTLEEIICGDVGPTLRRLRAEHREFDLIVVDPPKFARTRAGLKRALAAYRETNLQAMKLASKGALVFTCSCSGLVELLDFERTVARAARDAARSVRILARRGQGPDHPTPIGFPEGRYLKCLLLEVE